MPGFDDVVVVRAPLEEVWKLVHDPTRYPEWWTGMGSVDQAAPDGFTMYPEGWPDYPMPQRLRASSVDGRVTISCLVSDLEYRWQLSAAGDHTRVEVRVDIPEVEAHRLETQTAAMTSALARLADLAAAAVTR
jgi:carbon monoxide dehydrogenase subunit G